MQEHLPVRPVPYYRGRPEVAFGMQPVMTVGNTAESAMCLGSWALDEDGSEVHRGITGVLIDDTSAYAVLTTRGADEWGVSSQISVDFHSPIPTDAQRLICTAAVDHRMEGWGHSSGQVRTDNGELVATISQRLRFIPGDDSVHHAGEPADTPSWLSSLDSHLELTGREGQRSEFLFKSDPGMRNGIGTLHGGISLVFTELAARRACEASEVSATGPLRTASVRMSYLRLGDLSKDFRITVDVVHASRSVVITEVRILNADGKAATFGLVTLHRVEGI